MFERLQKPFLTTETGEAYQPIRIRYDLLQQVQPSKLLDQLKCCVRRTDAPGWDWLWCEECHDVQFTATTPEQQDVQRLRLGSLIIVDQTLYLNLPSFKRACLAVSFFQKYLSVDVMIRQADFVNKVFGMNEPLPRGLTELFKEKELDQMIQQRIADYNKVQERCEKASSAEEALNILAEYTKKEAAKRLPYVERYMFQEHDQQSADDIEAAFLSFAIFLRSRELVAIRRWFGQTNYTLANVADEVAEQVFDDVNVDILE